MSAHQELDRLVGVAGGAGWAITDHRARGVLWFSRGGVYVHLGVNAAGEPLSLYGGTHGRASRFWANSRDLVTGARPDPIARLEQALTEQEE